MALYLNVQSDTEDDHNHVIKITVKKINNVFESAHSRIAYFKKIMPELGRFDALKHKDKL